MDRFDHSLPPLESTFDLFSHPLLAFTIRRQSCVLDPGPDFKFGLEFQDPFIAASFLLSTMRAARHRHRRASLLIILLNILQFSYASPQSSDSSPFNLSSDFINPLIGNTGPEPNLSGGTLPSVAPPFGSCRWVAQNQQNWVSQTAFNYTESYRSNGTLHGFIGTRQPAIWMGESAWVGVVPGSGKVVKTGWEDRALAVVRGTEQFGVDFYGVELELPNEGEGEGKVQVEMSATSRVGHFRFTFTNSSDPYIFVPVTRQSTLFHAGDIYDHEYFPNGTVIIDMDALEICGSNDEMQDTILIPTSIAENAKNFKGFFCARFDPTTANATSFGITSGANIVRSAVSGSGKELGAFIHFAPPPSSTDDPLVLNLRIGTSLLSIDQARWNIDAEIPDGETVEDTRRKTGDKWTEKVGRFEIETSDEEAKTVFLTGVVRAMQFPYEVHDVSPEGDGKMHYYSAYDNAVHEGESYSGYSIWDTYRAAWPFQLLFAPERIPGLVRSMLNDYREGGWLPMWKNIVETNIMISTHADSLLAETIRKGFISEFTEEELATIWEAVWKDASVPPANDESTVYSDRQEGVDYEARAGLTTYMDPAKGWVADDVHSESVSRTLDFGYDDHVLSILASLLPENITSGKGNENETTTFLDARTSVWKPRSRNNHALSDVSNVTEFLDTRARSNVWTVWNENAPPSPGTSTRGYVQARFLNGSLNPDVTAGFTEGTREVYSFTQGLVWGDLIQELMDRRGGEGPFRESLDEFFDGGEVDFTNEPSHHTPYLYALASPEPEFVRSTQRRVRELAKANFNNTPEGLSGNEDCGQTSSWYIFSAMGFYPVDPASGEYVLGSPFFSRMKVFIPRSAAHSTLGDDDADPHGAYDETTDSYVLTIVAEGAEEKWFVEDVKVNGVSKKAEGSWKVAHEEILWGGVVEFDMVDGDSDSDSDGGS
ncbi:hypothetical protein V5O48_014476 [Marasmius crinis-equi]|uniref:Alpha-1,2-mannosidase n=1 Tax=Marasmius crinis-equi TaxID=585013 RepID=A0ABR3EX76_9AGAR